MLLNSESVEILDAVTYPVIIASPVYDGQQKIADFSIDYVNPVYQRMMNSFIQAGDRFSSFSDNVAHMREWFTRGVFAVEKNESYDSSFYSQLNKTWFHITISKSSNGHCVVTFTVVDELKRVQAQLNDVLYTDTLTGIPNRSYFNLIFESTVEKRCAGSRAQE